MIAFEPSGAGTGHRRRAVFLDRDGVLIANRDGDYVRSAADVRLIPHAASAVRRLTEAGFHTVVVTNQAGVGKGLMSAQAARFVHQEVIRRFQVRHARLGAGYLCPHAPADACPCRKPRPGLILHAAARWNIDLARSHLVGDALTDVAAGDAAGVSAHLVLTGRGRAQARLPGAAALRPHQIHDDLSAAVGVILGRRDPHTPP